jgi:hypothetical protein
MPRCHIKDLRILARAVLLLGALTLVGCGTVAQSRSAGSRGAGGPEAGIPQAHPQAIQPAAGEQAAVGGGDTPVGDPNAHAPPLNQIRAELKLELVAVRTTNAQCINPLSYVTVWGRTDQGVDAQMPVGAPIFAPCEVKILAVIPNWFAGQPLVYFELLNGPRAGRIQYVAEQITAIAPAGSILQRGQVIARFAAHGTDIEYGWSTINGVTLAKATSGYTEGQVTPAGRSVRAWLNSLGANAGPA